MRSEAYGHPAGLSRAGQEPRSRDAFTGLVFDVRRVVSRGRWKGDGGAAVVEFVFLGVLLMVPLVYLVVAAGRVQAASFAASSSAREAARAFVTADSESEAGRRARAAVRLGMRDQGFRAEDGRMAVECNRPVCLTPGGRVVVRVEVQVMLPGVPRSVGRALSTHVTVRARQVATVDEFRSVTP
jgi:Flp pilus assembly protein TadG